MTKLLLDFAILCNRANLISSLSLVRVSPERKERSRAIMGGAVALSKQMVASWRSLD